MAETLSILKEREAGLGLWRLAQMGRKSCIFLFPQLEARGHHGRRACQARGDAVP